MRLASNPGRCLKFKKGDKTRAKTEDNKKLVTEKVAPLVTPTPTPTSTNKIIAYSNTACYHMISTCLSLRDGVYLISRRRRKPKRGNTGIPMMHMSYCYCCCCMLRIPGTDEVRRCVFNRYIGRENVVVVRSPAVHQPHTHTA